MKCTIRFYGRELGALGIYYLMHRTVCISPSPQYTDAALIIQELYKVVKPHFCIHAGLERVSRQSFLDCPDTYNIYYCEP